MRFILVDKIIELNVGKNIRGIKNVSMNEDFFEDHFPHYPIFPGVLILESMAQVCGFLLDVTYEEEMKKRIRAIMSMVENVKYRKPVCPGDQMIVEGELLAPVSEGWVSAKAKVNDKVVATARIFYTFWDMKDFYDASQEEARANLIKQLLSK